MSETIWVLTVTVNMHDQHGDYFIAAWLKKPSIVELASALSAAKLSAGSDDIMGAVAVISSLLETGRYYDERRDIDEILLKEYSPGEVSKEWDW